MESEDSVVSDKTGRGIASALLVASGCKVKCLSHKHNTNRLSAIGHFKVQLTLLVFYSDEKSIVFIFLVRKLAIFDGNVLRRLNAKY